MKKAIGVTFESFGDIFYYQVPNFPVQVDDQLVIERNKVLEIAMVKCVRSDIQEDDYLENKKEIKRLVDQIDLKKIAKNEADCKDIVIKTREIIENLELPMKVISAEYTLMRERLMIKFSSDSRVDFRQLVKELAAIYHTRIELRQIGVRDEAQIVGGIGICGRQLCCSSFLGDFTPVSIKMAREQHLSLNPTKISGICGRLMCCLSFENETYEEIRKKMPDIGREIDTPDGRGKVVGLNILEMVITVFVFESRQKVDYYFNEFDKSMVRVTENEN
ncbi:Cell fate regulator YaaT, PSP1 superfamily (controls sporulation, competence, biofilm development) [Granulicatella balaenopterae]|uniref:Cell fate regulator YaaT, PSP1 superfamily (Controls sporulation, competence, biofilm development) n=1 Tax=Granulicatella balaenopterae TaxID=137733 RepID=A0A1H9JEK4_9LACT|nr:stage 0 sporulation family protein [Granulicatella balaenopterae]SEQ85213.1 Cell fate regulator YaaT, PSP1 superfamily (controls sporulation, competence, biofilm development) [Granulicatella balaenopterae]